MKIIILCLVAQATALSRSGSNADHLSSVAGRRRKGDGKGQSIHKPEDALWKCFPDASQYQAATEDLSSCFKYYSSCMSLWQNNIDMLLGNKFGSYCYEASIHNLAGDAREQKRNELFDFIHNTASPWWVNLMNAAQNLAEQREAKKGQVNKKKFMGSLMEDSLWKTSGAKTNEKLSTTQAHEQLNEMVANFTQSKLFGGQEHNEAEGMLSILQRAKGGFMINLKDLVQENIPAGIFKVALAESSQRNEGTPAGAPKGDNDPSNHGLNGKKYRHTGSIKIDKARGTVSPTRYLHATPGLRMKRASLDKTEIMKKGFCQPNKTECFTWGPWNTGLANEARSKAAQDELSQHCPSCPRGKATTNLCALQAGGYRMATELMKGNVPLYGAVTGSATQAGAAGNYYAQIGDLSQEQTSICVCTNTRQPARADWACYQKLSKADCEKRGTPVGDTTPAAATIELDEQNTGGAQCEHSGEPYEPVCNDGSSAVYYNSPAAKNNYNFHLYWPGGYFCFDETSCLARAGRYPMLVSGKDWEEETVMPGLFDPTEGGFTGWDHSMVSYCSSDAFVGAVNLGKASFPGNANFIMVDQTKPKVNVGTATYPVMKKSLGTHFKGAHVVIAMIQTLVWEKKLGCDKKKGEFVVSGCSAGAIGMLNHGDSIMTYIKEGVRNKHGCQQTCVDKDDATKTIKGAKPVVWTAPGTAAATDKQDARCAAANNNREIQFDEEDQICTLPASESMDGNNRHGCFIDGCKKLAFDHESYNQATPYDCGAACTNNPADADYDATQNCVCNIKDRFCSYEQSISTTTGTPVDNAVVSATNKATPIVKGVAPVIGADETADAEGGVTDALPGGTDGVGNGADTAGHVVNGQNTERLCTCKYNLKTCVPNKWKKPKITLIIDSAPLTTLPKTNKKGYEPLVQQAMNLVDQLYTRPGVGLWQPSYCAENFPGEPQKCAYATYRLPLMKTPHMVVGMLWDTFVPGEMITDGYAFPFGQTQKTWMNDFIAITKKLMRKPSKKQNYLGISCYDHCVIENPFFWMLTAASATKPPGAHRMTSQKILAETRKRKLNRHYVDECNVFNCGCLLSTPIYTSSALLQFLRDVIGFEVAAPR